MKHCLSTIESLNKTYRSEIERQDNYNMRLVHSKKCINKVISKVNNC